MGYLVLTHARLVGKKNRVFDIFVHAIADLGGSLFH